MEATNRSVKPSYQDAILFICSSTQPKHAEWSLQEERDFEKALALHDPNSSYFFQNLATKIPDKTIEEIKDHFEVLVEDIKLIEDNCFSSPNCITTKKNQCKTTSNGHMISIHQQTKKGARWTKEEHEKFLMGLNRFGKGDWRNISRNCVLTKTPTQVASHAQKYFIRLAKSSAPHKCSTSQDEQMVGLVFSTPTLKPTAAANKRQHSI